MRRVMSLGCVGQPAIGTFTVVEYAFVAVAARAASAVYMRKRGGGQLPSSAWQWPQFACKKPSAADCVASPGIGNVIAGGDESRGARVAEIRPGAALAPDCCT